MPRSESERTAKRVIRIADSMTKLEDKGRIKDPKYRRLAVELAEHLDGILDAREAAEHELHRALTQASQARKRTAEDRQKFEQERDEFYAERSRLTDQLNRGLADVRRQAQEIESERRDLATAQDEAKASRRRYDAAVETFRKGLVE